MAKIIKFKTFVDTNGTLTVCDKALPFDIKRVFWIYDVGDDIRGGHRHHKTVQALICVNGGCDVVVNDGQMKISYRIEKPDECLIVEPEDWHIMEKFTPDALLMVMASEHYDPKDYIYDAY